MVQQTSSNEPEGTVCSQCQHTGRAARCSAARCNACSSATAAPCSTPVALGRQRQLVHAGLPRYAGVALVPAAPVAAAAGDVLVRHALALLAALGAPSPHAPAVLERCCHHLDHAGHRGLCGGHVAVAPGAGAGAGACVRWPVCCGWLWLAMSGVAALVVQLACCGLWLGVVHPPSGCRSW